MSARVRHCLVIGTALLATGCSGSNPTSSTILPFAPYSQTDLRVGDGAEATPGRNATVNYTGWLYDPAQPEQKGRQFDTSTGRGPFTFAVGAGRVISGWDLGVAGMKVGGQRRLIIPPDLGYGSAGAGGTIPPNATLVFDIELLEVQG
ncbi:MAG: FKBP-type peptidyl-prolyl cis-trans isomerase [Acidobacteria bacterium]|nr:FKBP-type peptidyl-prolyl cis-trans isomerase [Acidobacteriota bacterium]